MPSGGDLKELSKIVANQESLQSVLELKHIQCNFTVLVEHIFETLRTY